jgi:hypothetical protein
MEQIVFPVPLICEYLTEETKHRVFIETERDEKNHKITGFFNSFENMWNEMKWQKKLKQQSMLYWISLNMSFWSDISFNFAVLLNLLIAIFYPFDQTENISSKIDIKLNSLLWTSLFVSFLLSIILHKILWLKKIILAVFMSLLVTRLVFTFGIHLALYIVGLINVSNKIVFVISYMGNGGLFQLPIKMILSDRGFAYHLIYTLICLMAIFMHPLLYGLLLLDFVNREETLINVIKCVTKNSKSVLLTAVFAFILIYLFSICGFLFFQDDFIMEVDQKINLISNKMENMEKSTCENSMFDYSADILPKVQEEDSSPPQKERACDTLIMCIITTLNNGLRNGGGIGDVLRKPSSSEPFFLFRLIYDLLFFFIVIIITLNLIFGVIIDTFGDLRQEKQEKDFLLKNTCFICGLERSKFDNKIISFDEHTKYEHNMWHYLYFLILLKIKNKTEFTGPESYVYSCIEKENLDWFPKLKAMSLNGINTDAENDSNNLKDQLESTKLVVNNLVKELDQLKQVIKHSAYKTQLISKENILLNQ